MDARITKQRLGVLLSYDWLKILGVIAAAVVALYVLFLVLETQPTVEQVYTVYTYGGLNIGTDSSNLVKKLDGCFSYDILDVQMENFDSGSMGEQALTARRGVLEGDAVFVSDYTDQENGSTPFSDLCGGYEGYNVDLSKPQGFYIIPELLADTETYLGEFFDGSIAEGQPIDGKVEAAFYRRNGSDKRFKTDAQKAAGIAQERDRILAIRDNYFFVKSAFDNGSLETVTYHGVKVVENANERVEIPYEAEIGVNLGRLTDLSKLFYYYQGENVSSENVVLLFFFNGPTNEEAKYENLALLRYLLTHYAPVHS